jgi:hypothetical protein
MLRANRDPTQEVDSSARSMRCVRFRQGHAWKRFSNLELQMRDQRLIGGQLRPGGGDLRLRQYQRRFEHLDIVGKGIRRQHDDAD